VNQPATSKQKDGQSYQLVPPPLLVLLLLVLPPIVELFETEKGGSSGYVERYGEDRSGLGMRDGL
jgi:hypothetical protein